MEIQIRIRNCSYINWCFHTLKLYNLFGNVSPLWVVLRRTPERKERQLTFADIPFLVRSELRTQANVCFLSVRFRTVGLQTPLLEKAPDAPTAKAAAAIAVSSGA